MFGEPEGLGANRSNERVEPRSQLGNVADGVDTRIAGTQEFVDDDAAGRREPGFLRQRDARRESGRDDDAVVGTRKLVQVLHVAYFDAARGEMLVQGPRLALAELQLEQARLAMEDRDRVPGLVQIGSHFAADQAPADHGPARLSGAAADLCAAAA